MFKKLYERGQAIALKRAIELANPVLNWFTGEDKLLDFGCGVGHLGFDIAQESGHQLVSLDVRSYPFTHPCVQPEIYDGKTIPFSENTFNTTLVAYTLHHTRQPQDLLQEIVRVSRNRIVVCEDLLISRKHIPVEVIKDLISNYFCAHITFQYKTESEWEAIFEKLGLPIEDKVHFSSGEWLTFNHVSWLLSTPPTS